MKRPLKLSTPREVRASLAKVVNEVRAGELSPQIGNCVIVGCNAILAAIRTDEQERQLMELEQKVEEARNDMYPEFWTHKKLN